MITVAMLNHPSTAPNTIRTAYFPHLRMQFTLDRNPVMESELLPGFKGVAVKHPNFPKEIVILDMPADAEVVFVTD